MPIYASKPACPWTGCHRNRAMNCAELLFRTGSKQRNNICHRQICRCFCKCFCKFPCMLQLFPYTLAYFHISFLLIATSCKKTDSVLIFKPSTYNPKIVILLFLSLLVFTGTFECHKLLNIIIFSQPLFSCEMPIERFCNSLTAVQW